MKLSRRGIENMPTRDRKQIATKAHMTKVLEKVEGICNRLDEVVVGAREADGSKSDLNLNQGTFISVHRVTSVGYGWGRDRPFGIDLQKCNSHETAEFKVVEAHFDDHRVELKQVSGPGPVSSVCGGDSKRRYFESDQNGTHVTIEMEEVDGERIYDFKQTSPTIWGPRAEESKWAAAVTKAINAYVKPAPVSEQRVSTLPADTAVEGVRKKRRQTLLRELQGRVADFDHAVEKLRVQDGTERDRSKEEGVVVIDGATQYRGDFKLYDADFTGDTIKARHELSEGDAMGHWAVQKSSDKGTYCYRYQDGRWLKIDEEIVVTQNGEETLYSLVEPNWWFGR